MTNKEKIFCQEYIKDFNGKRAAIKAGYSKKTAKEIACQNLTKLHIKKQLSKLIKPRLKKLKIDQQYVLKGIKTIADHKKTKNNDKLKAYELLGKYLKLFTEKIETNKGDVNINLITKEENKI